jgi:hypothetical protein
MFTGAATSQPEWEATAQPEPPCGAHPVGAAGGLLGQRESVCTLSAARAAARQS